jgi:SOS-response transcriptional repressor LexA
MNEKQTAVSGGRSKVPQNFETQAKALAMRPTKKQKELLDYIQAFIDEHGYSPSYREIMNGLAYTSVATVALHVGNLIKRGHLRKRDHSARSLEVVGGGQGIEDMRFKTNGVKAGEEKWLVSKVEQHFKEAESDISLQQSQVDGLYVLLGALRILGLESAAQSFTGRVSALKARLAESTLAG